MSKVEDFMAKLAAQTAPMQRNNQPRSNTKSVEKISLNFPGNFGRYQILPLDSVVTDYPYVTLFNTREIAIPKKQVSADGTETPYTAWVKLLPKEGYQMKDMTGRVVSSLTAEEEQLLGEAQTLFDQLFTEVDAKNDLNMQKNLCRKRNYTLFHAYCMNKWDFEESRVPKRQNFSGLFVCTAKGFMNAVEDNINERTLMNGGDGSWIEGVYNREQTGRDGFVMFSISKSKTTAGYSVTCSHESGKSQMLSGITIPSEDIEMMKDPVATFLGWQANREEGVADGQRRLFNTSLIKEAVAFMTSQLAAIRMSKQNGQSIEEAIKATNDLALKNAVAQQPKTNDPMLQASQPQAPQVNAERVISRNDGTSFPAAQIDPITGAAVTPGNTGFGQPQPQQNNAPASAPFTAPSFGGFGSAPKSDLPF